MENENIPTNEKERIVLDYTAKGLANWSITLRDNTLTSATLERLQKIDDEMRNRFKINVMSAEK
jgi:hypothetical protein